MTNNGRHFANSDESRTHGGPTPKTYRNRTSLPLVPVVAESTASTAFWKQLAQLLETILALNPIILK